MGLPIRLTNGSANLKRRRRRICSMLKLGSSSGAKSEGKLTEFPRFCKNRRLFKPQQRQMQVEGEKLVSRSETEGKGESDKEGTYSETREEGAQN